MSSLITCRSCRGFSLRTASTCPHCGVSLARSTRALRRSLFVLAGLAAVTLMACNSTPPCDSAAPGCHPTGNSDGGLSDGGAGSLGNDDGGTGDPTDGGIDRPPYY